jgi:exonuclease III
MIIMGEFNILSTTINCHPDQKINKESLELNNTVDQMDVMDFYRILYPTATEYTSFSVSHETFSKIDIWDIKNTLTKTRKLK